MAIIPAPSSLAMTLPLRCLPLKPKESDTPLACSSGVIWAKIFSYGNLDKESARCATLVCSMFRAIILMRRVGLISVDFSFPHATTLEGPMKDEFCRIATGIKQLPTFRMFLAAGITKENGIFINPVLYRTIQLVSFQQFQSAFINYIEVMKVCLHSQAWLGTAPAQFGDPANASTFLPYAQRLVFEPGTRCIYKGDLHGDLHSLVAFIHQLQISGDISREDPLKFIRPFKLIFLGDYVDRGSWGLEVIYLLMLLKIKNPEHVFLIRGNHEDFAMTDELGFKQEYESKFGKEDPQSLGYRQLVAFYNSLPVVLYVGSGSEDKKSFVQCCHGGIEWGYNPEKFLNQDDKNFETIGKFMRLSECSNLPEFQVEENSKGNNNALKLLRELSEDFTPASPKNPYPVGFMCHEFKVHPQDKTTFYKERKVFSCNKDLTQAVFAAASKGKNILYAAIRAHQHAPTDPLMKLLLRVKGCAILWNARSSENFALEKNTVITLLLSPDNSSGLHESKRTSFTFDTTLHVIIARQIEDWKCTVTNNEIYQ